MKNVFCISFLLLATMILLMGCSKDNEQNGIEESSIVKDSSSSAAKYVTSTHGKFLIVKYDEWGRNSRQCAGWGLCNGQWFVCVNAEGDVVGCLETRTPGPGYETPLQQDDKTKKYYHEILFDKTPTITSPLIVDVDIVFNFQSELGFNLKVKAGSYSYNSNLGTYGGYSINLSK